MYYIACLAIYVVVCLLTYREIKAAPNNHWNRFGSRLKAEAYKGLTQYDVKGRKGRTSVLPLRLRFLYWAWFDMHFILWFGTLILMAVFLHAIQGVLVVPESAYTHATGIGAISAFGAGAFFLSFDLTYLFSTATNRGVIRQADRLYRLGSFAEYPDSINRILCGILLLIGIPFMMLSLPACTWYTDSGIVFQGAFSKEYVSYNQIEEAQVSVELYGKSVFELEYVIRYQKDGQSIERQIYGANIYWLDIEKVDATFLRKGVPVRRIPISPELAAGIKGEKADWWVRLAFKLCGAE